MKLIDLKALIPKGSNTILAIRIRIVATWFDEKVVCPVESYIAFFIRMKELPQMMESKMSNVQYFS